MAQVAAQIGPRGRFIDLNLEGYPEVEAAMRALPFAMQGKVVRPAMRAAMRVVLSRAKATAPRRTGRLSGGDWKIRASKRKGFVGLTLLSPTRRSLRISASALGYYPFSLEFGFGGRRTGEELRQSAHMNRLRKALKSAEKHGTDRGGVSAQIEIRRQLAASQRPLRIRRKFPGRHFMRNAILGNPETLVEIVSRECEIAVARMTPKGLARSGAGVESEAA